MNYSDSTRGLDLLPGRTVEVGTLTRRRRDEFDVIATACTVEIAEEIIDSHDCGGEPLLRRRDGTLTARSAERGWTWVFTATETLPLCEYAERQRRRERRATLLSRRDAARERRRAKAKREAELARSREKPVIAGFEPNVARLRANADHVAEQRRLARAAAFAATSRGRRLLKERGA